MTETHQQHGENHSKHLLLLGAAGVAGGLILAPYALPLLGIGNPDSAHMMMSFIGGEAGPGFYGTGIAGALQKGIASLPGVGGALTSTASVTLPGLGLTMATGALTTILASAAIGIGGMMLANWLEKREHTSDKIHWSKIIRAVSLATSILISLPSILTGITVGITFLANLMSTQWGNQASYAMSADHGLGATSMVTGAAAGAGALGGLMAVLPHLFSCGGAIIPVMLAMFMGNKSHKASPDMQNTGNRVELAYASPTRAGQTCHVSFRLRDANGRALSPQEIETTHTEKLHTMLVDRTLSDYHHVHPAYDPSSGLFVAEFTPTLNQPYSAWHDFTPAGGTQIIAHTSLPSAMRTPNTHPLISLASQTEAAGITATPTVSGLLSVGRGGMLHIALRDSSGQPVIGLQPIMGAMAHLVGFSADGQNFMHCHPVAATADGVDFHVEPKQAGPTKFFLQLKRDGQEITLPFGLRIEPAKQFTTREAMRPAHSHLSAQIA